MSNTMFRRRLAGWIALGAWMVVASTAPAQSLFLSANPPSGGGVQYANPAGGTLTPTNPVPFTVAPNTGAGGVQLLATVSNGFSFAGWSGNFFAPGAPGDGQAGNLTVFANANGSNFTAIANFLEITPGGADTVTANVLPLGTGNTTIQNFTQTTSSTGGNGNQLSGINLGDSIFITANPNAGNLFQSWSGNIPAGATVGPGTLSFDFPGSNLTVTAIFNEGLDTDGDGLEDQLELDNGLDPEDPDDADEDNDEDGLTNKQELLGQGFCNFQTNPNNPDTDNDLMRDGWECFFGLDPTSSTGDDGASGNPDGDEDWSVTTGLPNGDYTNLKEYQRFVEVNNGPNVNPDTAAQTFQDSSTNPLEPDTDFDTLPDGWEAAYELDPIDETEPNGRNHNPDGDENYITAPNSPRSGMPIDGFTNFEEYDRYATGGLPTTDPNDDDTDEDGLPDGWESDFGLNPNSDAGDDGADGNPDGDFVYSSENGTCLGNPYSNRLEFNAGGANGNINDRTGFTTHPNNPDVDEDGMADNWELGFVLDPWFFNTDGGDTVDAEENSDDDYMADDGAGLIHNDVYAAFGFDPRTAWTDEFDIIFVSGMQLAPNTRKFDNLAEFNGISNTNGAVKCGNDSTNPRDIDTDGDGIHDGWERYVGLNPQNDNDAGQGAPDDGLNNLAEFQCQRLDNLGQNPTWLNKIWPTDPNDSDTDGDQISDGGERAFIDSGGTDRGFNGHCFTGSGMNPTSVDTDGDHIPDAWEREYGSSSGAWDDRNGMNPTTQDAGEGGIRLSTNFNGYVEQAPFSWDDDYDGDGLPNYQEYWIASVHAWQCSDPIDCDWVPGLGLAGYDPAEFFDLTPYEWDWHFFADRQETRAEPSTVPYTFVSGIPVAPGRVKYSSTDPTDGDTDGDAMDDFYEIYHGHSPLLGSIDVYLSKFSVASILAGFFEDDIRLYPHVAGHPFVDSDQDGLINADESLQPEAVGANYLHTDPSPAWITETSYDLSFVNLYYWLGTVPMFWNEGGRRPFADQAYMFSFESMEGYDTDNDILPDEAEILSLSNPGNTDPVDMEDPIRERFLYLDGADAALRTRGGFYHGSDTFQNFTLEAWVRPVNPATGTRQIVMERPIWLPSGNPACGLAVVQLNYRLGLLPDGRPFVEFSNNGCNPQVVTAEAGTASAVVAEQWVHLAATFDGDAGQLKLYIDGNLERTIFSSQRPANGFILPDRAFSGPVVIGAQENDPGAWVMGTPVVAGPFGKIFSPPGFQQTQPDLDHHFEGWLDQVRVWDGARSQQEIQDDQFRRLKRADVVNSISNRVAGTPVTPVLWNLYTFDDMPDPDYDPIIPQGFDLLNGRPNDGSYPHIPWWATANDRSTVYTDYLYIPWIENTAAHVPLEPPADSHLSTNTVPNTSNPYTFGYWGGLDVETENHPDFINTFHVRFNPRESAQFNDLLPLNSAVADQDVITWRGTFILEDFDTDGDGMPDDWETANGLDPNDATGDNGPEGDPDNDGISNIDEYRAGTDPYSSDSDGDGIPDGDEDSDGDGLSNGDEINDHGTNPGLPDTDDDGIPDGVEIETVRQATDSLVPLVDRVLDVDGTPVSYVLMPADGALVSSTVLITNIVDNGGTLVTNVTTTTVVNESSTELRLALDEWSVEAWVFARGADTEATFLRRDVGPGAENYFLGMDTNQQLVLRFTHVDGVQVAEIKSPPYETIPLFAWCHVEGTFDSDTHEMRLFVNGRLVANQITSWLPITEAQSPSDVNSVIGQNFNGLMDEVRVWTGHPQSQSFFPLSSGLLPPDAGPSGASPVDTLDLAAGTYQLNYVSGEWTNATEGLNQSVAIGPEATLAESLGTATPGNSVVFDWPGGEVSIFIPSANAAGNAGSGVGYSVEIQQGRDRTIDELQQSLTGDESGLVTYYRFDDGTNPVGTSGKPSLFKGQVEDFVSFYAEDWNLDWVHAGTLIGTAAVIASPPNGPVNASQVDSDEDGIPDWWELEHFGDLTSAGPGEVDGYTDADGDGVNDLYEYLADFNPNDADSDNDGVSDAGEDQDLDLLPTIDEQMYGTDPRLADTDDDGLSDSEEVWAYPITGPTYGMNPLIERSLALSRITPLGSGVAIPRTDRFLDAEGWTAEAWYKAGGADTGSLVQHRVGGRYQFDLGVNGGLPYIRFDSEGDVITTVSVQNPNALQPGVWYHLAGVWDPTARQLSLIINGTAVTKAEEVDVDPIRKNAHGYAAIGTGLQSGFIDQVRIWNLARTQVEVDEGRVGMVLDTTAGLVAAYRFDDGGLTIEDYAHIGDVSYALGGPAIQPLPDVLTDATGAAPADGQNDFVTSVDAVSVYGVNDTDSDDSDLDGLPNWFELLFGLDPRNVDSLGDGELDDLRDTDSDGLNNRYEYLTGNRPDRSSTDGASLDREKDSDNDGVVNKDEQAFGSDPRRSDSDEDGVSDADEIYGNPVRPMVEWPISDPISSLDPVIRRGMVFDGSSRVSPEQRAKYAQPSWTIEAWVRPDIGSDGGIVVRRAVDGIGTAGEILNYEIGVANDGGILRPYVQFGDRSAPTMKLQATYNSVPADGETWTYLAGTYSDANGLYLYQDGLAIATTTTMFSVDMPICGDQEAEVTFGAGADLGGGAYELALEGGIDEVRVWSRDLTPDDVWQIFRRIIVPGDVIGGGGEGTALITPTTDAQTLLDALLNGRPLPSGITGMNISLIGVEEASAIPTAVYEMFPQLPASAPLGDGILLTSGTAAEAGGVNDSPSTSTSLGVPGDQDLADLAGLALEQSFDAIGIQLSFSSAGSVGGMSFDMAFGSEEFPEFVGTTFNDAFGAILDGDNITFDGNGNPLTVNNNFFELNNDKFNLTDPDAAGKTVIDVEMEYDGFTPVLRTNWPLTPGSHTLKLIISDLGDAILDSGIFLSDLQFRLRGAVGTGRVSEDLIAYFRADDGGMTLQDFAEPNLVRANDVFRAQTEGTASVSAAVPDFAEQLGDFDRDGIADWWELGHGLDRFFNDSDLDPDADGLLNLFEYLAGLDPFRPDTDYDGVTDDLEDSDGDGLDNYYEQSLESTPGTNVVLALANGDTDDDGATDADEVAGRTLPADALSPPVSRVLDLDGTGYLVLPEQPRLSIPGDWTVELWTQVDPAEADGGILAQRTVHTSEGVVVDYEIGIDAARQFYVRYQRADGVERRVTNVVPVPTDRMAWFHVAGVFDATANVLELYVNGELVESLFVGAVLPSVPEVGERETVVGRAFIGQIDDVRIWQIARDGMSLAGTDRDSLSGEEDDLVIYYRFDDGGEHVQDFVTRSYSGIVVGSPFNHALVDWLTGWFNAATLEGGAAVIDGLSPVWWNETDIDGDLLPDWWELRYFGNLGQTGTGDVDFDGLNNYLEYLSNLHPSVPDTYNTGVLDGMADSDGDGLSNVAEQDYGTLPNQFDTDDDGLTDWEEILGFDDPVLTPNMQPDLKSNPLRSLDPPKQSALELDGTGRMLIPAQDRHAASSFTIDAWVKPDPGAEGIIIRRALGDLTPTLRAINYELGIINDAGTLRPYVQYTAYSNGTPIVVKVDGTGGTEFGGCLAPDSEIAAGEWSHVAGSYSEVDAELRLFIDGSMVAYRFDAFYPPTVGVASGKEIGGETTVGGGSIVNGVVEDGFEGYIDEVRILGGAVTEDDLRGIMEGDSAVATLISTVDRTVSGGVYVQDPAVAVNPDHEPDQLLVRFDRTVTPSQADARILALGAQTERRFELAQIQVVSITDGTSVEDKMRTFLGEPDVLYAEPNYRLTAALAPDDVRYPELWGMENTGQTGGTLDSDIDAEAAWDVTTGSRSIVVAVIDTGVDHSHPDLAGNMWVNTAEIPGNGIDDDGNGFVDDVHGYDFVNDDGDPMDDDGHGTHVAGTVGAVGNNGVGVVGVNWQVQIMALKFLDSFGSGTTADAIEAVQYATQMGAQISNNSWGGGGFSQALFDAIDAARQANQLFVAASGNAGVNTDVTPFYPAAYDLPNIVSVAATDDTDALASFSNFGLLTVDLAAPGVNILSTAPSNSYQVLQGTSMASPHVAGAAALILSQSPGLSFESVKASLLGSVDPVPGLNGRLVTGGRLNAANAVSGAGGVVALFTFDDLSSRTPPLAEDFTFANDYETDWFHAGILQGAIFSSNEFVYTTKRDSDGDGMPDAWEQAYGLSAGLATGVDGAMGDPDGDLLWNLYEYYAGTDPSLPDTDLDNIEDGDEDSDGDGLPNRDEQALATHPGRIDTDDDGFTDEEESHLAIYSNAADSMDPKDPIHLDNPDPRYRFKSMVLDGDSHRIPNPGADRNRFNTPQWTVEAWVKISEVGTEGYFVRYEGKKLASGAELLYYGLGVKADGIPFVAMQATDSYQAFDTTMGALEPDVWTHLAGVFDPENDRLALYRNGVLVAQLQVFETAMSGSQTAEKCSGKAYIGDTGITGNIDEVRIWSVVRTQEKIQEGIENLVQLDAEGQIVNFRFDDGRRVTSASPYSEAADGWGPDDGQGAEDFTHRLDPLDLESAWLYSLRDITFDVDDAYLGTRLDNDDLDCDLVPDWFEQLHFDELLEWTSIVYSNNGSIISETQTVIRVRGDEESSFSLNYLGWEMDFTPIVSLPGERWFEVPDTVWIIKDFCLDELPDTIELRVALTEIGSTEFYINGVLFSFGQPGIVGSPNTFPFSPQIFRATTHYVPNSVLAPLIREGRNRFTVKIVNEDGNPTANRYEYFNLELLVDGADFIVRRGDDPEIEDDTKARWWWFGEQSTQAEPPIDNLGRAWNNVDYGLDTFADPDEDGLANINEYKVRTNPRANDTDADAIPDWGEDYDGDGLVNVDEQSRGTEPRLPDTDDDGFFDFDEVMGYTDPTNSLSPLVSRLLRTDGGSASYLRLPVQDRFTLTSWTIEAWVRPASFNADAQVISRQVESGIFNYYLGLDSLGRVVAKFTASDETTDVGIISPLPIPVNSWAHLSASFDETTGELWLEIDGVEVASKITARQPASNGSGSAGTRVGQSFNGYLDEVRFWSDYPGERTLEELSDVLLGTETGLVSYLRFEDDTHWGGTSAIGSWSTGQVQDFAMPPADWVTAWANAATMVNGVMVMRAGPDAPVLGGGIGGPQTQDCPIDGPIDLTRSDWNLLAYNRITLAPLPEEEKEWSCTTNFASGGISSVCAGGVETNVVPVSGGFVTNRVPVLADNEGTLLFTTVIGPGEMCFSYRVSTEALLPGQIDPTQADFLLFQANNATLLQVSGEFDWTNECFAIPAGVVEAKWAYTKDLIGWVGGDQVCVDDISFIHTGPDTDGDSLPDAYELYYGTNPLVVDSDNDGTWDGAEVANGSDPLTPEIPIISSVRVIGGKVCVEWLAEAGRVYQVQRSTDMVMWVAAPNGLSPEEKSMRATFEDGLLLYCDPESPQPTQPSYRVIVLQ